MFSRHTLEENSYVMWNVISVLLFHKLVRSVCPGQPQCARHKSKQLYYTDKVAQPSAVCSAGLM